MDRIVDGSIFQSAQRSITQGLLVVLIKLLGPEKTSVSSSFSELFRRSYGDYIEPDGYRPTDRPMDRPIGRQTKATRRKLWK